MTAARQLSLWKGPRQRGTKAPPALEFKTHCMVADVLRRWATPGWWWTHIPSGEKRTTATGAKLKRMGFKPGMSDFLLISPTGQHIWLELKRGGAKLSEHQEAFQTMLMERHVERGVAFSFEGAVLALQEWGAVRARLTA